MKIYSSRHWGCSCIGIIGRNKIKWFWYFSISMCFCVSALSVFDLCIQNEHNKDKGWGQHKKRFLTQKNIASVQSLKNPNSFFYPSPSLLLPFSFSDLCTVQLLPSFCLHVLLLLIEQLSSWTQLLGISDH